ncbi:putative Transmembrane amino acid transporter family protein [Hibiscus syriacus]|uniref:Transmembrane amino acid transporter family protein n=1 Tax=Hibiscus syriacus TaxID=106335 RepID=A0A6A3BQF2_HIBSY|nr:uncharacterized protein LOC120214090 [Hibiscus syriacus]KAE8717322.1 putative Transmembrane amino acid transporter family protein [Hibiscus syriacus]
MASFASLQTLYATNLKRSPTPASPSPSSRYPVAAPPRSSVLWKKKKGSPTVIAAVGDVSADGTTYLIAGAAVVALVGTAFPILFSRKDTCPECDGAGFVRKAGAPLRANAARKDQAQIVCARCNGLGKLNQIDK